MTGIFLYARARSAGAGMINEAAPVVVLRNLAGKTVSLGDLKGKVVFVDFWASWCGPCKQELPEINRFITKYKDSDAVVLAVNIDKTRSNVDEFLSKIQNISNKMLIVLDPDAKVVASYNARMMPTSFIIDKTGVVRYIHFGYRENDPDTWAEEVEGLLKQ
ncbi:MAG: TlpA family protein disulfide reductase [Deltaproteobacteria bacterium]|nr:TlpA family protein disulfide reductase [Deltaproteobacteria bacterium]